MDSRKIPQPQSVGQYITTGTTEAPVPVIERSADPVQLLANILNLSGTMAAQWGEEIYLHLQVAALWARIGKREKAAEYIISLARLHGVDAFHLGYEGVRSRIDMMRFLLMQLGIDEATLNLEDLAERSRTNKVAHWLRGSKLGKVLLGLDTASSTIREDDEMYIRELVAPKSTWLEHVYLTRVPPDTRQALVHELNSIDEYGDPDGVEQKLYQLFDHCRRWHERKSDTPIWVHDLDDVGPRAMYLAVNIGRPNIIVTYIERCIDALHERPLALMTNIATAIGGLAYVAKQQRRDDLLNNALDALPRLPEHERCIAALTLVEVLIERPR
ncbi:MAG: hypothetical protein ACYDBB_19495 [Armatimonadota bacterium]